MVSPEKTGRGRESYRKETLFRTMVRGIEGDPDFGFSHDKRCRPAAASDRLSQGQHKNILLTE